MKKKKDLIGRERIEPSSEISPPPSLDDLPGGIVESSSGNGSPATSETRTLYGGAEKLMDSVTPNRVEETTLGGLGGKQLFPSSQDQANKELLHSPEKSLGGLVWKNQSKGQLWISHKALRQTTPKWF
jgi:hypothetical protein